MTGGGGGGGGGGIDLLVQIVAESSEINVSTKNSTPIQSISVTIGSSSVPMEVMSFVPNMAYGSFNFVDGGNYAISVRVNGKDPLTANVIIPKYTNVNFPTQININQSMNVSWNIANASSQTIWFSNIDDDWFRVLGGSVTSCTIPARAIPASDYYVIYLQATNLITNGGSTITAVSSYTMREYY